MTVVVPLDGGLQLVLKETIVVNEWVAGELVIVVADPCGFNNPGILIKAPFVRVLLIRVFMER